MHPTRRAILIVVVGTALAAIPALGGGDLWGPWLFFWLLVSMVLALDVVLMPRARDLTLEVEAPDTLFVGEAHPLAVRLRLAGARATPTWLKLELSPTLATLDETRVSVSDAEREVTLALSPRRRGPARVEAAWLRYRGRFGMIDRIVRRDLDHDLEVVPSIAGVRRAALEYGSRDSFRMGLRIERFAGDGSEFDSLREFMPGLDHRTIDWKASARHAELLCRQFRAERNRQIVVAIDSGHLMAEPIDGLPRLDHAIHAGLLLAYFSVRAGDKVGLYAFDARPQVFGEPRSGMAAFRAMLALSAGVSYSEQETNFTLGLTDLMGRLTRRSLVVVLTDFVDTVTAELMLDNVERLTRRHLVVFVSLRDPMLDRVAAEEPRHLLALDRAVVAESLLRERERVTARLRRLGVFCVDAAPDRVGVDLLNRYLAIKRREMI